MGINVNECSITYLKDLDNGAFLIKTTHPTFVLLTRIRAEFSDTCINQQKAIPQDVLSVYDNIAYIYLKLFLSYNIHL